MMEPSYWEQRWSEGRIGFHEGTVNQYLERYWGSVVGEPGARVLVPLCGKAVDLDWLRARGHGVLGVELSQQAIDAFHEAHGRRAGLTLLRSDFLALPLEEVKAALGGAPQAWYDRAALVALPPEMRRQYVARLRVLLPAGACGLLVSFAYPQEQKQGPPFSVEADEVAALYAEGFEVELLEDADRLAAEPVHREQGLTRLREQVWRLRRV